MEVKRVPVYHCFNIEQRETEDLTVEPTIRDGFWSRGRGSPHCLMLGSSGPLAKFQMCQLNMTRGSWS